MNSTNANKKKQRRASQRFNPLGYGEIDFEAIKVADLEEDTLDSTSIVDKLQSFDPQVREIATISLAQIEHFTEDILTYFVQHGVFKLLIERLVDANPMIALNSLMALSNIAETGLQVRQKSIGDVILDNGILVLLESLLSNFKEAHAQRQLDMESQQFEAKVAFVDQSYKLLSLLAETVSENSIDLFLDSKVTTISLYLLNNCDEPKILTGIASYLQVLTEISVKLCQQMSMNLDFLNRLVVIAESSFATQELRAYVLGALYNYICTLDRNNIAAEGKEELCQKVLKGILDILGIKIFEEVKNLLPIYEAKRGQEQNTANGEDPINHEEDAAEDAKEVEEAQTGNSVHDLKLKQALGIWSDSATAIQICIGIVINMFESEEALEEDWKDEDDNEEEQDNGKPNKYEPPRTSFMTNMSHEIREKILGGVADKCQHLSEEVYGEFLNDVRQVVDQSRTIIEFAFPCILNILLNIEYSDKHQNTQTLNQVAEQLFKVCLEEWKHYMEILYTNTTHEEAEDREDVTFEHNILNDILKVITDLIQSSTHNLASLIDVSQFLKATVSVFNLLSQESKVATIDLIGTRCHPKFGLTKEENGLVGDFLLELLKSDDVMIVGEALNALFDVYSEENYDDVFVQKGFMDVLNYGFDVFKKKIADNRSQLSRENYALLRNHLLNLKRFIKYKQEHIKAN